MKLHKKKIPHKAGGEQALNERVKYLMCHPTNLEKTAYLCQALGWTLGR